MYIAGLVIRVALMIRETTDGYDEYITKDATTFASCRQPSTRTRNAYLCLKLSTP